MTTNVVNNGSVTDVAGETNIRQAIAQAQTGDVILLDVPAGQTAPPSAPLPPLTTLP